MTDQDPKIVLDKTPMEDWKKVFFAIVFFISGVCVGYFSQTFEVIIEVIKR